MDLAAAAAGSFPEADNGQPVPWEDPGLSRLVGFGRTLGKLLFHPEDFCAHLGPGGRAEPFAFGLIAGTAGLLGCFFWYLLLAAAASRDVVAVSGDTQAFTMGAALVIMALAPILILIELLIGSLCLWAGAALLGLGAGFTPAWRIYCYVQGGVVLALIPIFGVPLAAIWMLLLIYRGVATVWQSSVPQTLAVLAVFLVLQALIWMVLVGSSLALMVLGSFLLFLGGG